MKTFKEIREGFVSAAQRKAVWASRADGGKGHPDNKKKSKKEDAVADFLAKGGKIKKLPPAKAQGYHGKDDPGKGMAGMMDKGDTKAIGTRKKVKSMGEANKEKQVNELDTNTLISYRKKANKQRYSNNVTKRAQRTKGVDQADKKLTKRGVDKFDNKVKENQDTGTAKIGIKTLVKGKEVEPKPTFGLKQIVKGKEVK